VIEVAEDADDLPEALQRALAKPAARARNDHSALIKRLQALTHEWFGGFDQSYPEGSPNVSKPNSSWSARIIRSFWPN
jgi:hypothetical protein